MAAVDVVMPAPVPPPQPPVLRISRLALAAADAVLCLWIASLWVLLASVAAAIIGGFACGWGCPGAAWKTVVVSVLLVAIVWPLAAMLLRKFVEPFYTNQLLMGAAALEPISEAVIGAHIIATTFFGPIELFGLLLLWAGRDHDSAIVMALPPLGICVLGCFVSIPVLAVRVWRMRRRHSIASVVPI